MSVFTTYFFPAMNKYWIFCRIRYIYPDILKVKPGWLIWGDKAHLGVDVIWDSVSGSAVLHDLLPLKGTWKCQNVTACPPCEKHCSVGFGPFPQTSYTFRVSSQISDVIWDSVSGMRSYRIYSPWRGPENVRMLLHARHVKSTAQLG